MTGCPLWEAEYVHTGDTLWLDSISGRHTDWTDGISPICRRNSGRDWRPGWQPLHFKRSHTLWLVIIGIRHLSPNEKVFLCLSKYISMSFKIYFYAFQNIFLWLLNSISRFFEDNYPPIQAVTLSDWSLLAYATRHQMRKSFKYLFWIFEKYF